MPREKKKSFIRLRAFSLIEVVAVILIIGIIIAGTIAANKMISKFRIASAQTLATSSPIQGISETALWLETSLDTSFNSSEASTGTPISAWNDQKASVNKTSVTAVGGGPTYSNTINYIHAVEFANAGYLQFDGSFLNNTDYTIIVLEKRKSSGSNNYFLGSSTSGANNGLLLGYSSDSIVVHKQGTNSYTQDSAVSSYSNSNEEARLFTFVHSSTGGKKTYINGTLAAQDSANTAPLSGVTTLSIGQGYTGEIAEIAIFTKALTTEARQSVENYVGKKLTRKINRDTAPTCLIGAVTNDGCDASLATCSLSATGISRTVSPAATSTSATCNGTHYSTASTVNYTCINGVPEILSGTCACATGYDSATGCTTCASNYEASGSGDSLVCTPSAPCSISVAGVSTTSVNHGTSATLTCNATGYDGGSGPTYNCVNGDANLSSATCSCDTSDYYASGSTCLQKCTFGSSVSGILSGTKVNQGSSQTITCNDTTTHLTNGTITYTCGAGNSLSSVSGTCTCGSGYYTSGSSCLQQCDVAISGTTLTGFTSGTKVNQGTSQTLSCNNSAGYFSTSDSIVYTCADGAVFSVVSGACNTCASTYGFDSTTSTCKQNLVCTGGTTTTSGGRKIHKFANYSGTYTFSCTSGTTTNDLQILGCGAGGSSGNSPGGGGGGGGQVILLTGQTLTASTSITVTISESAAMNQASSTGSSISASGSIPATTFANGGGGGYSNPGGAGGNGGGGGGARTQVGGTGTPSGSSGSSTNGGSGGSNAYISSISGTSVTYGNGGSGGSSGTGANGARGTNCGGSGGSSGPTSSWGGVGADPGIVIFSYPYYP